MKNLRHFLLSVATVFCIIVVIDIALGKILDKMLSHITPPTAIGKTEFALNKISAPIVIVGSSRASHHYVAKMIEDSLGIETYNVGRDGCFFSYQACIINSILDRYTPKYIIWELDDSFLYEESLDPLESLYPYYGRNSHVTETINAEASYQDILFLKSNIYRYNSLIIRIMFRYFTRGSIDYLKGYAPLTPKEWFMQNNYTIVSNNSINKRKVKQLKNISNRIKVLGAKLIIVQSPVYTEGYIDNSPSEAQEFIQSKLTKSSFYYFNNKHLNAFISHPEYFNDRIHLNKNGAELYTTIFIKQIKEAK